MMWDIVCEEWTGLLRSNEALIEALGGDRIYPAQSARAVEVPSIEWVMFSDTEEELFNPILVQVDYWAEIGDAMTIERLIRSITHRDTSRVLGGYRLWTHYLDSRSIDYPDRTVLHRSLDFEFKPVRSKYANL